MKQYCKCKSCSKCLRFRNDNLKQNFNIEVNNEDEVVIALAGNPNVGKSTVFNSLTGLKQHTGNWPGKTVANARGSYTYNDKKFVLVDLPGTYSLLAHSVEEQVARDFICFGKPNATVVIVDATCIERNLNLVLQVIELTDNVIVCVNLMDEAKRKGILVDTKKIEDLLGVPVVQTSARDGVGLQQLMDKIYSISSKENISKPNKIKYSDEVEESIKTIIPKLDSILKGKLNSKWVALRFIDGDKTIVDSIYNFIFQKDCGDIDEEYKKLIEIYNLLQQETNIKELKDTIVENIYQRAEIIYSNVVTNNRSNKKVKLDRKIDNVLTSKIFGFPIMILILAGVLWITIVGANYPSQMLSHLLFSLEDKITQFFMYIQAPDWLYGILVLGMYRTMAWVISVMLPPMAIFFPLFTLLEDLGYLPRVAFNLDKCFKKSGAHGKQSLTMCMGFGCNAAGIISCRIIESPRERLIAMITNNFVPCNGRFPTLIAIATIFVGGAVASQFSSIIATLFVTLLIIFGIFITLLVSKFLSKTLLKGVPSSFTLELPPYRKPQIWRVIYTSIIDRTIFVLGRAIVIAIPAGAITWLLANISIADQNLLTYAANFLDPFALMIGLDGFILMAFILGLPANEIVIPILIMSYMSQGSMLELDSLLEMENLFVSNGWTFVTALNVMLFSLLHFPCGTTLYTIRKESGSAKWTLISAILPTVIAIVVCFGVTQISKLISFII